MRIGVIGAGAVGGAIAALLARAGHEVVVAARGVQLEAIRDGGIRMTGGWGAFTAEVEADERLARGVELVVVATKAQDAGEAIVANSGVLSGIPLVVVQNGLDALTIAEVAAPRSDIVGGLATFASSSLTPGEITVTAIGQLYVGVAPGHGDVPARYAARILDEVLPTTVVADFPGAQWTKLVINQVNALPAITGLSVQEVVSRSPLRRIMTESMREAVHIGRASGIRFGTLQGLGDRMLRVFAALPPGLGQALPALMARQMGATPNPGSTLQSVRRGQPTEIDYLNGAVVRAAEALGRAAPMNAGLVRLVHEVEAAGGFIGADTVPERLRTLS